MRTFEKKITVLPFRVPTVVYFNDGRTRENGGYPSMPLEELDEETLKGLCDDFVAEIMKSKNITETL